MKRVQAPWLMPKVMIVENDRALLTLLASSLGQFGHNVVAITHDSIEAIKIFKEVDPSVVILDIDLGNSVDGVELAIIMQKTNPNIRIIFLTSFSDQRFAFISKKRLPQNFVYLRKQEISNIKTLSDTILQSVGPSQLASLVPSAEGAYYSDLSNRDVELMRHISKGYSNAKIAKILEIQLKSCENAISRLLKKLEIPVDAELNQRVLVARKYFELSGKEII